MNDLEQRLRHTLHELADTVPRSENPKADFERRLAEPRGIRRPALVAAAAIAVLAGVGIAIPLAVQSEHPPAAEQKTDGLRWSHGYDWVRADSGPYVLGTFTENGATVEAVAWVREGDLCVGAGHRVAVGGSNEQPPGALVDVTCGVVPTWPTGPAGTGHVQTRSVLPAGNALDSGPVPGLMLFLTDPAVTELEVRDGPGADVVVRELARTGGLNLYLADFAGSSQGFGYTARDAAGNVVESAIT
jgi:hypothetical protein